MTNKSFDELSNRPDYPPKEAAAIGKGAIKYWTEHKAAIIALRDTLSKDGRPNRATRTPTRPST